MPVVGIPAQSKRNLCSHGISILIETDCKQYRQLKHEVARKHEEKNSRRNNKGTYKKTHKSQGQTIMQEKAIEIERLEIDHNFTEHGQRRPPLRVAFEYRPKGMSYIVTWRNRKAVHAENGAHEKPQVSSCPMG
jgi:hypothetical protein